MSAKGNRRKAREEALQILYQLDLNEDLSPQAGLHHFQSSFNPADGAIDDFTHRVVNGVTNHLKEIDTVIEGVSENWRKARMAAVDRNILRIGVFELLFCDDIPATVSINEMIELAKHFGAESSPAFINGVLDKVKATLNRPEKAP